ncbi:Conserved_hypothetical protein [Hexamita inflata]|uniref:Uncharacterized protein n=1 Tax=Hexamita inflata TaxID=28002 RepID=A0AA86NQ16_9EUKA|nr:Conserved hypothetical protein [Hexamita inflata]CAI9938924.1 Conserved hypothetical protein [Hexamita inflata]
MQSNSQQQFRSENQNIARFKDITSNKEILEILQESDNALMEMYQSQIIDEALTIYNNKDLKSLDFIHKLNINKLELWTCYNIIPKLESKTIKKIEIMDCYIQSIKDFKLENLEILIIQNHFRKESDTLVKEIVIFSKLKELTLGKWTIDISPLSQIVGLNKLYLIKCELRSIETLRLLINLEHLRFCRINIDLTQIKNLIQLTRLELEDCSLDNINALKPLVNLIELNIDCNPDIDITSVQFLTKLIQLSMFKCCLVNVDPLCQLLKLEELRIYYNSIVYIQPLCELKQLSKLYAHTNKLVDIQSLAQHPYYNVFSLVNQNQPTPDELEVANVMRDINNQVTSLKNIFRQYNRLKSQSAIFRQYITQQLQKQNDNQLSLFKYITIFFTNMNEGFQ